MKRILMLIGAALAFSAGAALAQDKTDVTIVLNEEVDLMEPCMATRSDIGRVVLQNINETQTELDVRGDKGLIATPCGKLGTAGRRCVALSPAQGREILGWQRLRFRGCRAHA